jgi:hypothetical protein
MKMAVFWVVAACGLVEVYQRFRGAGCLHHQGNHHLNTSETLVNFYQTTWHNKPEDRLLHKVITFKATNEEIVFKP